MIKYTLEQALRKLQENGGRIKAINSSDDWWLNKDEMFVNLQHLNAYDVLNKWVWEPENKSAFQEWSCHLCFYHKTEQTKEWIQTACRKEGWNAAIDEVLKFEMMGIDSNIRTGVIAVHHQEIEKLKEL